MNNETYFLTIKSLPMQHGDQIVAYTLFPYIEPFDESLKALQNQVGGHIEHFIISDELNEDMIDMWIDEEGKFKDYKPTFLLCTAEGEPIDAIMGNCVFTKYDHEGYTHGLNMDEVNKVIQWLGTLLFAPVNSSENGALEYAFIVNGFHRV